MQVQSDVGCIYVCICMSCFKEVVVYAGAMKRGKEVCENMKIQIGGEYPTHPLLKHHK